MPSVGVVYQPLRLRLLRLRDNYVQNITQTRLRPLLQKKLGRVSSRYIIRLDHLPSPL